MVFTCITNTGILVWYFSDNQKKLYWSGEEPPVVQVQKDVFTLQLINATGSVLISTATVHNVSLDYKGRNVTCSDSIFMSTNATEPMKTIRISMSTFV